MGQRHQIYIRIPNPVKYKNAPTHNKEGMKKLRQLFGNGKNTILALHHQWLYGRSPIALLISMLNIMNKENMGSNNPFHPEHYIFNVDDFIKNMLMCLQVNTCTLSPRGVGIEGMHFLNEIDGKWVLSDFTCGDNNDGITIIDTIDNKYCFMNIYDQSEGELHHSASDLPKLIPSSAMDYMTAYYGTTKKTVNDYYIEKKTAKEIKEVLAEFKKDNTVLAEALDKTKVSLMTLKDVKKIFPKVYKEKVV